VIDQYVNPSNPNYPWLNTFASLWQKWQLRNLRIHYQHYESTVVAGEVLLKYSPDPDDNLAALTEEQVGNSSNMVRGGVYEDFMLECDISGVPKIPMDTDFGETNEDDAQAGRFAVFSNHWSPPVDDEDPPEFIPSPLPGNIYLEFLIDFVEREIPEAAANPARLHRVIRSKKLTRDEKIEIFTLLVDEVEKKLRAPQAAKMSTDIYLDKLRKPAAADQPKARRGAQRKLPLAFPPVVSGALRTR
jgi:hypothetical protein